MNHSISTLPYTRDITAYETSSEFPDLVRTPMLTTSTGSVNFDVDRRLPQGDSTFNSARSLRVRAYYFWQRLGNEFPFIAVLTYAEQDLVEYDYHLHKQDSDTLYFDGYDTLPSEYIDMSSLSIVTIPDVGSYALDFSAFQAGPTSLSSVQVGASYANQTFLVELHRFLNELNLPGNSAYNPGVANYVKSEGLILKRQEPHWKNAWSLYAAQFGLQMLYVGAPTSVWGQYPAYVQPVLLWYNPSRRPWYQVAVANSGKVVLTAPYVDALLKNTVSTICRAIYADDTRRRLIGVVSVDLTYPPMHAFVFGPTGCRLRQADINVPACFLFDESAILTTSFRFYDPIDPSTGGTTPIADVFLGNEEPELAAALIARGLITQVTQDDFSSLSGTRRTQPYKVVDTLIANGTIGGTFSSPCQEGGYYVMKVYTCLCLCACMWHVCV